MDQQRSPHTKVFIQRDFSDGIPVKFQTRYPPELEGRVDRATYERTINTINEMFADAESLGSRTYCESCFACLTGYIALLCMDTYYEKTLKKVRIYLEEQNQTIYMSRGVMLIDPAERGLRILEIDISSMDTPQR
ncbi:golgin subfamily A member 7 [Biomphalaria glabrata]|uniref:Ras modification protein ERF4 n=1 Tax=Biomphalaria glabrata TaxID=6526 RepID=A0A2C9KW65_BIOGL|nr:golgin subfamily A member 7-like [Biomphalaria glabrata]XP_013089800.1 golgin subfamily A member 7-like [Biomphalaria glabrata]KAI8768940.1 golgin subfamily A member 7-like [Biomphalaria glabrata]KAI8789168.1 golgin subfamily A member 7 [Biomphalaria glabrata]